MISEHEERPPLADTMRDRASKLLGAEHQCAQLSAAQFTLLPQFSSRTARKVSKLHAIHEFLAKVLNLEGERVTGGSPTTRHVRV